MQEMIKMLTDYCDSVSGAESEIDLRNVQDALNFAHTVVTLTICSRDARLTGKICDAISLENRTDTALERLRKLQDDDYESRRRAQLFGPLR